MTVESDRADRSRTDIQVLIIGADPKGLVLALWLIRLGVGVRIIDKPAESGTKSRALAVQARASGEWRRRYSPAWLPAPSIDVFG